MKDNTYADGLFCDADLIFSMQLYLHGFFVIPAAVQREHIWLSCCMGGMRFSREIFTYSDCAHFACSDTENTALRSHITQPDPYGFAFRRFAFCHNILCKKINFCHIIYCISTKLCGKIRIVQREGRDFPDGGYELCFSA